MPLSAELQAEVNAAWAQQDYAHGRDLLEKASVDHPDDLHLRSCFAAAQGYCSRFESARIEIEKIMELSTPARRSLRSGLLGIEWSRIGRPDLAEPLLRLALESDKPPAPLFETLADCLERLKRLQEADAVLDDGFSRYPGHPGLLLVRARVSRRLGNFEVTELALRQISKTPLASPLVKTRAAYELGHLRESQGRYLEAYQAFTRAKIHQREEAATLLPLWRGRNQLLKESQLPGRSDFEKWHSEIDPDTSGKLAFLVGCPRSGTTLLERVLDAHPQLVTGSEIATFTCEVWMPFLRASGASGNPVEILSSIDEWKLKGCRKRYWDLLPEALEKPPNGRLVIDKNPSLLAALPMIGRIFPDAKILMALRDPRAIAWSCFSQYLPVNSETVAYLDLATTFDQTATSLNGWIVLRDRLSAPWREVRYESVVADLERETREVLDFLGLAWDEAVMSYHQNSNPVLSPSYAQASRPVYADAVDRFRHYEEFFESHRAEWEPVAKTLGYD